MTLRERRCVFTATTVQLLHEVINRDWPYGKVQVAFDEGTVHTPRRVRFGTTTGTADDGVHARGSRHYEGLALDLLVFIDGEYISDGSHPIWREIDLMARVIDPRLSLGIEFHDANHLSWEEGTPAPLDPGGTVG